MNPTTTLFPHQAVEVSLWVKPVTTEKAKSFDGSNTCISFDESLEAALDLAPERSEVKLPG
ncbi:MAG: hypothetical protein DMG29_15425 [Acidobacteria bacterium]|nr:MAG: hypothetical protein DMG29_15425 [Acidobacteriota bacterium]